MLRRSRIRGPPEDEFQPSPEPKPGCCAEILAREEAAHEVSTLTRAEARVLQPPATVRTHTKRGFNPHPSRSPGAAAMTAAIKYALMGFNPHPSRSPGAALYLCIGEFCLRTVSTLTRAEARVLHQGRDGAPSRALVSTLTRAEARVLHNDAVNGAQALWFQPSPEPKPGCCVGGLVDGVADKGVSTLTRAEARVLRTRTRVMGAVQTVSTLTRAEARVLHLAPIRWPPA